MPGDLRRVFAATMLISTAACAGEERAVELPAEHYALDKLIEADSIDMVRDVRQDGSGNVWVLAASPPFFTIVNAAGKIVKSGGRRGRGPSDFLYPYAFLLRQPTSEGPAVIDLGRHQLVHVDTSFSGVGASDLRLLSGVMRSDMPKIVPSLPLAVAVADNTILAVVLRKNVSNESDLSAQSVVRLSNRTRDTLWAQKSVKQGQLRWLQAYSLWDSCGEEGLVGVDLTGSWLMRVRFDGTVDSSRVPLSNGRRRVTQDDIRRHARFRADLEFRESGSVPTTRQLDEAVEFAARTIRPDVNDSLPAFAAIKCVSRDEYWLQHFDLEYSGNGASRIWYRVNRGHATRISLPVGFQPLRISGDGILGLSIDANDVARIAFASRRR